MSVAAPTNQMDLQNSNLTMKNNSHQNWNDYIEREKDGKVGEKEEENAKETDAQKPTCAVC